MLTEKDLEEAQEVVDGWDEDDGFLQDADDVYALFVKLVAEVKRLQSDKNGAYSERNQCVALLSKVFQAWLEKHDENDKDWEDDWRNIVFIELPTGQASWHIHDSELRLFDHLSCMPGNSWDGHTTIQKYARMALVQPHQILAEVKKDFLDLMKHTFTVQSQYAKQQRKRADVAELALRNKLQELDLITDSPDSSTDEEMECWFKEELVLATEELAKKGQS